MSPWIEKTENKKHQHVETYLPDIVVLKGRMKSQTCWCLLLVMDPGIKMPEHYISVRKMVTLLLSSSEYKIQLSDVREHRYITLRRLCQELMFVFVEYVPLICRDSFSHIHMQHQYSGKIIWCWVEKQKGYCITYN